MLRTPPFRLDGKRALIIGASSGIGQACAVALGEYGAGVTLAARRSAELEQTAQLVAQSGGTVEQCLTMDLTQIALSESLISAQGPFDILLNAAGTARHSRAVDTQEQDFDVVNDLNFKGAYFAARAVAKGLIAAGIGGSIITISSQMALVGGQERAVYAGTKTALEGMTRSMAVEWGAHNIRVNTICPTFIRTQLTEPTFSNPEHMVWIKQNIKLPRVGEVQDIMGAAVFLASDAASMITGTALVIDGGWTAS